MYNDRAVFGCLECQRRKGLMNEVFAGLAEWPNAAASKAVGSIGPRGFESHTSRSTGLPSFGVAAFLFARFMPPSPHRVTDRQQATDDRQQADHTTGHSHFRFDVTAAGLVMLINRSSRTTRHWILSVPIVCKLGSLVDQADLLRIWFDLGVLATTVDQVAINLAAWHAFLLQHRWRHRYDRRFPGQMDG